EYDGSGDPPGDSFDFTVSKATDITGIEIISPPTKTEYVVDYDSYANYMGLQMKVSFAGGLTETYSYSTHYSRFLGMYVGIRGSANGNNVKLGNNTFTVEYAGFTDTFELTGIVNPVESISVSRASIKLIENTSGYEATRWDYDIQIPFWYYDFNDFVEEYVIHYTNGDTETYDSQWEVSEATGYSFYSSNDQYSTPWEVGKHDVTYNYLGKTAQLEVEIVESPVERFTVSPSAITLIENTGGWEGSIWDADKQAYVPSWHYADASPGSSHNYERFTYEVQFAGGEKRIYTYDELIEASKTEADKLGVAGEYSGYGYYPQELYSQYSTPLTLGSNNWPITFMGATDENFKIEIIDSFVESFTVSPGSIKLIENTNGSMFTRPDSPGPPDTTPDDNQGTPGSNETGSQGSESPAPGLGSSVSPASGEPIKPSDGSGVTALDAGSDTYWYYNGINLSDLTYTVKFKDETEQTYTYDELSEATGEKAAESGLSVNEYGYYPQELNSQYDTALTLGSNAWPITFMGVTDDDFTVEIIESPVESFTVSPSSVKMIKDTNGWENPRWDSDEQTYVPYWEYTISLNDFTYRVQFKGGSEQTYNYYDLVEASKAEAAKLGVIVDEDGGYYPQELYFQFNTPLTLGDNPWPITFMGAIDEDFKVEIAENPLESFTVLSGPINLIENTGGHEDTRWGSDLQEEVPYYRYDIDFLSGLTYKVKFTGGSERTYTNGELGDLINDSKTEAAKYGVVTDGYYPQELYGQWEHPLTLGANPWPILFMGKTADFTVNIVNEIEGIAIKTPPSKSSYIVGREALDPAGLSVNVTYNDERGTIEVPYTGNEDDFSIDSLLVSRVGANTFTVTYKGCEAEFTVTGTSPIPTTPPDGGEEPEIPVITLPETPQGGGEPTEPQTTEQAVAAGETVYFAFTPVKTGTYRFSVSGGAGADAYLFDGAGNMLAYRLVSGEQTNTDTSGIGTLDAPIPVTVLEYELEAATNYYVGAKFSDAGATGRIGVSAEEVEELPAVILGDVNESGTVTIADVTRLRKYLVDPLNTVISFNAADMNESGSITITDLTRLRKQIAG
ncbi:MAG: dockerin type I domain-containing protein, partial [Clostridiales Family XIII bacterium]|nr:dockerin type I domain-containing protein [Clostridiales Family XIII bacterium]